MSTTSPAARAHSPTPSSRSATSTTASHGAAKAFVSALLVLPPSSSPTSSPSTSLRTAHRRSSISAGVAQRGLFSAMTAAMPEEQGNESPPSPGSASLSPPPPESPVSPLGGPPAFGAPRPFGAPSTDDRRKRKSSRRPATSGVVLEDKSLGVKRASVASGTGAAAAAGANLSLGGRAAAMSYVDGVRGIFKGMGIPVSTLRSTALISSHITPTLPPTPPSPSAPLAALPSSGSQASAPATSSNLTFLILVSLNDHSSRPPPSYTARLILESGKTPSSICFDLDSEIRGKEAEGWEEERLEAALRSLTELEARRKEGEWKGVGVVIIAYSANANLSDAVKRRALHAGADLVLHPPYDTVHPGVPIAIQGAADAAFHEQMSHSGNTSLFPSRKTSTNGLRRKADPFSPPTTPPLATANLPPSLASTIARSSSVSHPGFADDLSSPPRRASVDVGAVSLAFSRALERVDEIAAVDDLEVPTARAARAESELELAELLMGMHLETQRAVSSSGPDDEQLLRPMTPEKRRELAGKLDTWGFEPHMLDETDLFRCAQMMFQGAMWCEGLWELDIPQNQLDSFLLSVRQTYHAPNPYHNYIHATDVLQATYTFMTLAGVVPPFAELGELNGRPARPWQRPQQGLGRAGEVLRPEDVFAVVVAAIGHDAAHPGLSNVFMKNAKTPLSQIYNDTSVLENMHCLLITTLLRKHGFTFLFGPASSATLNRPSQGPALDWTGFRKILFSTILATDMAMHFGWIVKLGELGDKIAEDRCSMDEAEVWEDRIMICQALMKCSDISNPTRPHAVSEHWSTVLLEEWTQQAFLESGLKLPVSVVKNADAALQAKGQVGFIDLFVQPLFNAVSEVIPQLEPFAKLSEQNRALWSDRLATLTDGSSPSFPIKPSKFSGPPLDTQTFSVPCPIDSPYRTVFPYTLPGTLIAEIVDSKLPGSALFEQHVEEGPRPAAGSSASASIPSATPLSPTFSASVTRPTLAGGRSDSHKKSFRTAYDQGVGHRKREATASSTASSTASAGSGFLPIRPGHGRHRSGSHSSQ